MIPKTLALTDFRNIARAEVELAPRLTFFRGNNAQGKTNTLEALAYAVSLRPLRRASPRDLIRRGTELARVDVSLIGPTLPWQIGVTIDPQGRRVEVNGKPLRDPANLLGAVALVAFTPDDLALVKGAPEVRRKSLDRFVFQVQPAHLRHLRDFQRALRSRNLLLKRRERDPAALAAFTETLVQTGARLMAGRQLGVSLLEAGLRRRHRALAPDGGELDIAYRPSVASDEGVDEEAARQALTAAMERWARLDLERRQTCRGPHHDDILLTLDGEPVRRFASQGQARTIVLALRMAEVDELARVRGEGPLLLADDLIAELDDRRAGNLLTTLEAAGTCVVATGTRLPAGLTATSPGVAVYDVDAGEIQRV